GYQPPPGSFPVATAGPYVPTQAFPQDHLSPEQQKSAAALDAMFASDPGWSMPAARPEFAPPLPPVADPVSMPMFDARPPTPMPDGKPMRTGVRRGRSKLQIAMWIMLGALVIGGGVVAGFKIRSMRLAKQISAAREQAVALATKDTWQGWVGAR